MRVVAGRVKGHHLKAPAGSETRPTSDKVREAIFAMLHDSFLNDAVLDLFAGTGALGIEALSRGASSAVFVERRGQACQAIRDNLRHTRFEQQTRLLCAPVERVLQSLQGPFGLVLLDPPYDYPNLRGIIEAVGAASFLGDDATVVFEHSPRFGLEQRYGVLALQRHKIYGDTAVAIFEAQKEQVR